MKNMNELKVLIKGAGEMATGIAHRLYVSNIRKILMLEIPEPLAVRRTVAFCEAVYDSTAEVEGLTAKLVKDMAAAEDVWNEGKLAVIVDPRWASLSKMKPDVVIDAVMAKRNTGTVKTEAPLVIGVGPGFTAPVDVHAVVESNRGHFLGRVILEGSAEPFTPAPGEIMMKTHERVLRAPGEGIVKHAMAIGDTVKAGDTVLYVDSSPVNSTIDGVLRGIIREIKVVKGEKVGDVDPRAKKEYCYTISEKARGIGGGVLEALMHFCNLNNR